ncbi:hypothetical protein TeGR_g6462 [Tetraparma gracilis]|uniref:PH domain-containing protein n=1 Tax=Tetraparma gracilis TaxID=2962635 RepID=A0ABQ6MHY8_9STRA|nr:hypothetical protein TeGR_g6462 [Tetraparma gracilis]
MGCGRSKQLSVLETLAAEKEREQEEVENPMSSPPLMTKLSLTSSPSPSPASSPNRQSLAQRMSVFGERLRGSSLDKKAAASEPEPIMKPPPAFLFVGRRFRKHHRSTFAELAGLGQGRILKLESKHGSLVWYKSSQCVGVPEPDESLSPDGAFKLEQVVRVELGCEDKPSLNQSLCFTVVGEARSLYLEAESPAVATEWCTALQDHLKHGMLASVDLGDTMSAEAEEQQHRKSVERERAYSKHKEDRDKLRAARVSSAQRASVFQQ